MAANAISPPVFLAVAASRPDAEAASPGALSGVAVGGSAGRGPAINGMTIDAATTDGPAAGGTPSRAGFVIVTLPGASRPLDASMFHILTPDDLRRVRDDHGPTPAGSLAWDDGSGQAGDASPASVDDAVIAAHVRRVALLHDRIVALCAADGASLQLAALRGRLHRAEAAWRLAAARTGETTPDDAGPARDRSGGCRLRSVAIASAGDNATPHAASSREAVRVTLALRHAAAPPSSGVPRHGPAFLLAARMGQGRPPTYRAVVRLVEGAHQRHRAPEHHAADAASVRLAQARRSLARARRVLAGSAAAPSPTVAVLSARPAVVLASLWRWEGSDRWRLSPAAR